MKSFGFSVGFDIVVEDSNCDGRLDMAIRFNDNVYLFEFKVMELAGEGTAMARMLDAVLRRFGHQIEVPGYSDTSVTVTVMICWALRRRLPVPL